MDENTKINLNIAIEPELLEEAESLFKEIGMDLSTAIHLFMKKAIKERGIPFEIKLDKPAFDPIRATLETMYVLSELISNDLDELLDVDDESAKEDMTKTD